MDRVWAEHRFVGLSLGLFCLVALALGVRLRYGIDFSDESFYVALPYAFNLGHRPIVDELSVHQFAALMLVLPVKVFMALVGSQEGLVLYVRQLYFLAALATSLIMARTLARVTGWGVALLVAASVLAYVPFSIPSLSYNTIASLGLVSGLFLLASASTSQRPAWDLFLGTFFLSLVAIAYIPLAPVALAAAIACTSRLVRDSKKVPRSTAKALGFAALLGAGLPAAWLGISLFRYVDISSVGEMMNLNRAIGMQGGGLRKAIVLMNELYFESVCILLNGLIIYGSVNVFRRVTRKWLGILLLLLAGPALFLASYTYFPMTEPYTSLPLVLMLLAFSAVFGLRGKAPRGWGEAWSSLRWLVAASMFAGVCIAWASANGLRNSALGFLPAALVGLALFARPREEKVEDVVRTRSFFVSFLVSFLGFALYSFYGNVYRDAPLAKLDTQVVGGAYDGIYTTPERREFLAGLEADLADLRGQSETVFFFDYFPAGYLLSDLVPETPALWTFMLPTEKPIRHPVRTAYARHFQDPKDLPDLIVEMRILLLLRRENAKRPAWDPVRVRMSRGTHDQVMEREHYRVLRKADFE